NRNGPCIAGPYAQNTNAKAAAIAANNGHWEGVVVGADLLVAIEGAAFLRGGAALFLAFMSLRDPIAQVPDVELEYRQALRQRDVVVAQMRHDHRISEKHDQKDRGRSQKQRKRRVVAQAYMHRRILHDNR